MSQRSIAAFCMLLVALAACAKADVSQTQDASIMATFEPLPDLLEQTAISEAMKGYWRQVCRAVPAICCSHALSSTAAVLV